MSDTLLALTTPTLPEGTCWPSTPQALLDLTFPLAKAILPGSAGSLLGVVSGTTAPTDPTIRSSNVWVQLDSDGNQLGVWIWNGSLWIRPHRVPAGGGERMIWAASEASLWAYDGSLASNPAVGAGQEPTLYTGSFWIRDTAFGSGESTDINSVVNGVHPFRIPVGAGKNSTVYDGGSANEIVQGATGGEERHSTGIAEMPPHTHGAYFAEGASTDQNHGWDVAGSASAFGASYINTSTKVTAGDTGTFSAANKTQGYPILSNGGNGATPPLVTSHQNMPPFLGVIFAKRTIRQFYTAI